MILSRLAYAAQAADSSGLYEWLTESVYRLLSGRLALVVARGMLATAGQVTFGRFPVLMGNWFEAPHLLLSFA